jgi:aryl-alcohol dehydrogenase (NADP+)
VVLATKGRFPLDDAPNGSGLSARHLTRALDASLRRLGLDAVDLYQAHAFDPWTPLEETLRTLDGFVRAGKARYYGLSNFTGWQLTKAVHLARAMNIAGPVTLQPQYSLLVREIEWEIVPAAPDAGIGLLPWSPLGGGWLSGKYERDARPGGATRLGEDRGRGMEAYGRRGTERTWRVVDAVRKIAAGRGVTMAEIALAWVTGRPAVSATILGARTAAQLEANLRTARSSAHRRGNRRAGRRQRSGRPRLPLRRAGCRTAQPQPGRRQLTRPSALRQLAADTGLKAPRQPRGRVHARKVADRRGTPRGGCCYGSLSRRSPGDAASQAHQAPGPLAVVGVPRPAEPA